MARTRAVPRRRPNINFQQRGNIDFERPRVAATRNIISSSASSASSAASSSVASPARRSPLRNLARNLARNIGRNPIPASPTASPPASPIVRPIKRKRRRISESSSASNSSSAAAAVVPRNPARNPPVRRRIRAYDVKIKFVLPRVKDVEVKHNGRVVKKMKVQRVAKHAAKKRNVRYR